MKRRLFRIAVLALGVLLGLGITLFLIARHMGAGTIQEWIGSQIQGIANAYLNPKLSFTELTYEYPLTVSLKNLHLTADDPHNPGHTIDIIACEHAEVSLAEIPSIGKPIIIEKIALIEPLISAVAVEPHSKKFVGFSNLIRGSADVAATPDTTPNTTADTNPASSKKLSDVFRMRLVQIINGKVVYDPRIPGTVPMALDKINTLLNIEKTEAGWYNLDTDIARNPVFDLQLKGKLNLDTFSIRDADIKLMADLGQDKLSYLPPELQALLKQYDAKGKLSIGITGDMPVMDPMSGHLRLKLALDRANIAMVGLRIPVDSLSLETRFEGGEIYLPLLRISALNGIADLSGSIALNKRLDAMLHLNIAHMVPEKLLADPAMASASPAKLDLDLNLAASLMSLLGKAPIPERSPLASINLRNFRLTADDPVNPGKRLDLAACRKLDVELSQPIVSGKPMVIDKIILDSPTISAVSTEPGSFQLVGIPNFPSQPAAVAPASPSTEPSPPMPKVAQALQVKTFQLNDAKIIYDPRIPGTRRMYLDQIDVAVNIDPNDPGSYKLTTNIDREPIFKLVIDGEINIDNPGLQNLAIDLEADLTQDQLDFLPPQLQLILMHTGAKGKLNVKANTSVAMSDPSKAEAQLNLKVQNIDFHQGEMRVPVKEISISAQVQNRKLIHTEKINALNKDFEIHGVTTLNNRLDSNVAINLKNIEIESILAALKPDQPAPKSSTLLNAEIELQSPLMVAFGAIAGEPNEPAATAIVRNLRLTTDNPITPGQPMDFVSSESFKAILPNIPTAGKRLEIGPIEIEHPSIRAVAMAPQSNEFAGFTALQNLAAGQTSPDSTAENNVPATQPAAPASKLILSNLFRLQSLTVFNASLYYDPRMDATTPLSLDQIATTVNLDSEPGNYRFDTIIPSKPDFNLELAGHADIDSLFISGIKMDLKTELGKENPKYLPPQLQVLLKPFNQEGTLHVTATGAVPLLAPADADITANIAVDNLKLTAGHYRLPFDQIRLPARYKSAQIQFLDPTSMGGPTITAFDGVANLTGDITLNDRLDTTISLKIDGMLLQDLMAAKMTDPKTDLVGAVHLDLQLVDAPILVVVAEAVPPPATEPSAPPPPAPEMQSSAPVNASPKYISDLPTSWGSADIEITHARLAGLELLQGVSNLAKSAFADLFNHKDKDTKRTVTPKETAQVVCNFVKDHIYITQLHYEGEVMAADGKGFITLEQQVDLYITGGLIQKLGGMGSVGDWIKQASDSLLYYHVTGTFQNLKYEAKRGNGKPITKV